MGFEATSGRSLMSEAGIRSRFIFKPGCGSLSQSGKASSPPPPQQPVCIPLQVKKSVSVGRVLGMCTHSSEQVHLQGTRPGLTYVYRCIQCLFSTCAHATCGKQVHVHVVLNTHVCDVLEMYIRVHTVFWLHTCVMYWKHVYSTQQSEFIYTQCTENVYTHVRVETHTAFWIHARTICWKCVCIFMCV